MIVLGNNQGVRLLPITIELDDRRVLGLDKDLLPTANNPVYAQSPVCKGAR
jgi:hypothetical protein